MRREPEARFSSAKRFPDKRGLRQQAIPVEGGALRPNMRLNKGEEGRAKITARSREHT
jgi:hypothetical protein